MDSQKIGAFFFESVWGDGQMNAKQVWYYTKFIKKCSQTSIHKVPRYSNFKVYCYFWETLYSLSMQLLCLFTIALCISAAAARCSSTVRKGSNGECVKVLQKACGVTADGIFGSGTEVTRIVRSPT